MVINNLQVKKTTKFKIMGDNSTASFLDDFDIKSIENSGLDENIINEILGVYRDIENNLNDEKNPQGEGTLIKENQLHIQNRRSLLSRLFRRYIGGNTTNDILRQSIIVHELTHEVVARSHHNRDVGLLDFQNAEHMEILRVMLAPEIGENKIGENLETLGILLDNSLHIFEAFQHVFMTNPPLYNLYTYICYRLDYAVALQHEYPTVINELYYLLRTIKNGTFSTTDFYHALQNRANEEYQYRNQ